MHQTRGFFGRFLTTFVALTLTVAVPLAVPAGSVLGISDAQAQDAQDALSQARAHYKQGSALYSSGRYQEAIEQYSAANKLSPSPLLAYNIGLCYDSLGNPAEALSRYRGYLREVPNARNRVAVEGKIRRLEGTLRKASAEERDKVAKPPATSAAPPPSAPASASVAGSGAPAGLATASTAATAATPKKVYVPGGAGATGAASTAATAATPKKVYVPGGAGGATGAAEAGVSPPAGVSSEGSAQATNLDPEFARVQAIDVGAIRDQRAPSPAGGEGGHASAKASPAALSQAAPPPRAPVPTSGASLSGGDEAAGEAAGEAASTSTPIYKQWWFWAFAGLGAIIIVDRLTTSSSSSTQAQALMLGPAMQSSPGAGALEWRF